MKITFITGYWVNLAGGTRVISIYAEYLHRCGHEVLVVCPKRRSPGVRDQLRSLLKGNGTIKPNQNEGSHFDGLTVPRKVLDHIAPVTNIDVPDADVVMACWWETAEWVLNLSPSKGRKFYFMQDYGTRGQELEKLVPTWEMELEMITISKWLQQLVLSYVPDASITTVLNSVDFNVFHAEPRSKQKAPTFGFVYVEKPDKGYDTVLDAFRLAREMNPSLRLLLFGPSTPDCQLPTGTQFHLSPSDEEVRRLYASCDAWLFASVIEGFGLPILEAMACRTPVIATPAGCSVDVIDETNGIIIPSQDPAAMADAMLAISKLSEDKWRILSDNAHNSISSYTWDDAAGKFCDIISSKV